MSTPFPNSMDFGGFNAPSRVECDIYDLVVAEGKVPEEISGSWYRSVPIGCPRNSSQANEFSRRELSVIESSEIESGPGGACGTVRGSEAVHRR
jgi:hypothetical protein